VPNSALRQEAQVLAERIIQAALLVTIDTPMDGHTAWEVNAMLGVLHPDDLTPVELMGLAIILATAHTRLLRTPPTLRLCPELGEVRRPA
jgi:hypothetical protein